MQVTLLYGTESGSAEVLCEDIEAALNGDYDIELADLDEISPSDLTSDRHYIFVCSTYGDGELPASAVSFADALSADAPDLSQIRFSIFGLGDRTYMQTYNFGSKQLAEMLLAHQATQVGPRGLHDASTNEPPEDIAIPWVKERLAEAG
ncbi:MAG: flavodoxin domain-containing protein [Pseudomonadota bacterium]